MSVDNVTFSGHAVRQMHARSISRDDVLTVLREGETIADYPDDKPFPSRLLLAFIQGRPVHVVAAYDFETKTQFVVTAYLPDTSLWTDDFKVRRT